MDISSIHFHDTQILRVIEDTTTDILTMEVKYPVDWEHNVFEKRCLIFEDVHGYQTFEEPFYGCPTILDVSIISTDGKSSRVRLETNAGHRELNCTAVRLIDTPSMPSLVQDLERLGAGVFVTDRGVDTRLGEADLWRAFEEPVIIWAHGQTCDDTGLDSLLELARKFPHLQRFRFTSSKVTHAGFQKIREIWPNIPVDGVVA